MRDQHLTRLVEEARQDAAVLAVILFGSAVRGEARADSDLDVCLVLTAGAGDALDHRLRYAGRFDLDVQVFQALPLPMRSRVLKEGRPLFARDEDALYEVALRTVREFEDFRYAHALYLDAVLNAGS